MSSLKDVNATKIELEDEEFLIDENGDIVDDGNTTLINWEMSSSHLQPKKIWSQTKSYYDLCYQSFFVMFKIQINKKFKD